MNASEFITTAFLTALGEMVEHYAGAPPEVGEAVPMASSLAAMVGFSDGQVKGCCILTADPTEVLTLVPGGEADPGDWLGELNNQVVGRMKNKTLSSGLVFQLTPPVTTDGVELRFRSTEARVRFWSVRWAGGLLSAQLVLNVPPGLTVHPEESADVAEEGSLNLF